MPRELQPRHEPVSHLLDSPSVQPQCPVSVVPLLVSPERGYITRASYTWAGELNTPILQMETPRLREAQPAHTWEEEPDSGQSAPDTATGGSRGRNGRPRTLPGTSPLSGNQEDLTKHPRGQPRGWPWHQTLPQQLRRPGHPARLVSLSRCLFSWLRWPRVCVLVASVTLGHASQPGGSQGATEQPTQRQLPSVRLAVPGTS